MEHTVSLKLNHVFRRLYGRGKSAVNPCLAVYCRKNNLGYSRLGLTVGVKLGKAVVRNRTRRRIKEAYRIHEGAFFPGYDRHGPYLSAQEAPALQGARVP